MPFPVIYDVFLSEDIHVYYCEGSSLSLEAVEKDQMYKYFWPPFFGQDNPNFLYHFVSATYCLPFGDVWLSCV